TTKCLFEGLSMRAAFFVALLLVLVGSAAVAQAQPGCYTPCLPADCSSAPCQAYEVVEKTVLVPTWVTETRRVKVTEYRTEQRQRTVTVCRQVPQTRDVTETYTVMVPEKRTHTERF